MERPENGGKPVQWNEGDPLIMPQVGVHVQAYNTTKSEERIRIRGGDELGMTNG